MQDLHSHPSANDPDAAEETKLGHQITALLVKVRNPVAMMNLPREINQSSNLLAASPSHVMARFMKSTGLGRDVLAVLGYAFLLLAVLMLTSVLTSGLAERRYDLAVLRVLGSSAGTLIVTVLAEGIILAAIGSFAGVIVGHLLSYGLAVFVPALQSLIMPSSLLPPVPLDSILIVSGIICGGVASLIPCILAAKTNIAELLAQR